MLLLLVSGIACALLFTCVASYWVLRTWPSWEEDAAARIENALLLSAQQVQQNVEREIQGFHRPLIGVSGDAFPLPYKSPYMLPAPSGGGGQSNTALIALMKQIERDIVYRQREEAAHAYTPLLEDDEAVYGRDEANDTLKVSLLDNESLIIYD